MTGLVGIVVEGATETIAKFALMRAQTPTAAKGAATQGAEDVLDAARARVPVDTGALWESLHATEDAEGAMAGTDSSYAVFVEYGTEKMAAEPFLRPAADDARADFTEAMAAAIRGVLGG